VFALVEFAQTRLTGAFTLYQQGTFAPDFPLNPLDASPPWITRGTSHRLHYSASSNSLFPAIRYKNRPAFPDRRMVR